MSWLSSGLKSIGKTVGPVIQKVAPFAAPVLAATGVGLPLAALLAGGSEALGHLASGDNLGKSLGSGLTTGATGLVTGGAASGIAGALGAGGGIGSALGGALKGASGGMGASGGLQSLASAAFGGGGSSGGGLGSIGGLGNLAGLGLGAAGLVQQNQQQGKANSLLEAQTGLAQQEATMGQSLFNSAQPIRTAAEGALTSSSPPASSPARTSRA